jgi:hypothetical protein
MPSLTTLIVGSIFIILLGCFFVVYFVYQYAKGKKIKKNSWKVIKEKKTKPLVPRFDLMDRKQLLAYMKSGKEYQEEAKKEYNTRVSSSEEV